MFYKLLRSNFLRRPICRHFAKKVSPISIKFKTSRGDHTAFAEPGETILDAVINNDVPIDGYGACEGNLDCSTCHVILQPDHFLRVGEPSIAEMDLLDNVPKLQETSRLGCQIVVTREDNEGITVTIPSERNDARSS